MRADERYELELLPPRRLWLAVSSIALFLIGALGGGDLTYGRRRAVVRDRSSRAVIGRYTEPVIVGRESQFGLMIECYRTDEAEAFESQWLASE